MTCRPKCSVIIPTYNRRQLLRYTLLSMSCQTLPRDEFEVLVIDDGSTDGSNEEAAAFDGVQNIRYFYQEDEGYRVAAARNIGIAHAAAPICVFVDSGVILHSKYLESHWQSHNDSREPAAVVGYLYCFSQGDEDSEQIRTEIDLDDIDGTISRFRAAGRWVDIREKFYARYGDEFGHLPAPWPVFWTGNASAPTNLLREVGLFDETFRSWGAEDIDLGYRLHRGGSNFLLNRDAAGLHYPHPKDRTDNKQSAAANYRYFAAKHGTPITQLIGNTHFFDINDVIVERGLPRCEDWLRIQNSPRRA
jgi:glycosyltransferase involved in cell wall biosynthesis